MDTSRSILLDLSLGLSCFFKPSVLRGNEPHSKLKVYDDLKKIQAAIQDGSVADNLLLAGGRKGDTGATLKNPCASHCTEP